MTLHVEKKGAPSPIPYTGFTLCGRMVSTKRLVDWDSTCAVCESLQRALEVNAAGAAKAVR